MPGVTKTESKPQSLEAQLRSVVRGEVYTDQARRGMYATDASHYQVMPRCVVVPQDEADVAEVVRLAQATGTPITGRGAGTSLAGQTFGEGIVLDFSKHMNQVLSIDVEARTARVQPGIVRDHLNAELAPHAMHFAPDPATTSRATVGGMISNNSSGMRSVVYGMTIDHVVAVRVMLSDGTVCEFSAKDAEAWEAASAGDSREAQLYQGVGELIETHHDEIERRYPKVMRRVSGYALDALLDQDWRNLASLIVGSEGTLGLVLEATVKLTPLPGATALCLVHFDDLIESLRHVPAMLEHGPSAIELLDEIIVSESMTNPATCGYAGFYEGSPNCVQIVEFMAEAGTDAQRVAADKARAFAADMKSRGVGTAHVIRDEPRQIAEVWELRRLGVGLQSNIGGRRKPLDFIDDACVPVEHLAEYVQRLIELCDSHEVRMPICCHASVGVLHPKPMLDLHEPSDRKTMRKIAEAAFEMVVGYGGSWSSEHGDGTVRGAFVKRFYGDTIYIAFRDVKRLFDPANLMNPGKVIDTAGMDEHLRHNTPDYDVRLAQVKSNYRYEEHGGFGLSVEQCNGVGACRKVGKGTMCPSYMATRDEDASTRGRANVLRLAMTGQLGGEGLADQSVMDAMSLCLSCKACKTECPNAVDMSKMKSDVLQMHHDKHGTPMAATLVGHMRLAAALIGGSLLAGPINYILSLKPTRSVVQRLSGIDRRRTLPRFAGTSLSNWEEIDERVWGKSADGGRKVLLFADTYANYFEPNVGIAAVKLLRACGYSVEVVNPGCCQRPAISKGLVRLAKHDGEQTLMSLARDPYKDLPILFIEPSCASAIVDDLPDLVDDRAMAEAVKARCLMLDDFLADELEAGRLAGRFESDHAELLIHGHCHQKALFGTRGMHRLFGSIEDQAFTEVDSGCCGMAGSFGYEHHDLSMQIGEQRLFPAVRAAQERGAVVCANGISCRHQISDGCGVQAKHWVELLRFEAND